MEAKDRRSAEILTELQRIKYPWCTISPNCSEECKNLNATYLDLWEALETLDGE